jgi:alpha-amylase
MTVTFSDNPIVYHLITDRFTPPSDQRDTEWGTFHGGRLSGITMKLREGWFSQLGVNAILISAPYEQIHGWVPGADALFKHYAYHGYYALDFTVVDPRFGTEDDLRELVSTAHGMGIRVVLDIVLNHPGYPDFESLDKFGIAVHRPGWQQATPANYHEFMDDTSPAFQQWWGPDWIRSYLAGHPPFGTDELTMGVHNLPDFRTECEAPVALPTFLKRKQNTRAKELPAASVRDYLVTWLTQWVRDLGIDGFRCDSARHVELDAWLALKTTASQRLREYKAAHPCDKIDDAPFWMLGEAWGHGINRSDYFDFGFDCMLNFQFQHHLAQARHLDQLFDMYARRLAGQAGCGALSYVSSHDTELFDRSRLMHAATALMLAPGGVLIFYGDETGRLPGPPCPPDPSQATRSDMNWDTMDTAVLAHWRKLGQFRLRHPAIAKGAHRKIGDAPYAFARIDAASGDRVVVALDVPRGAMLDVAAIFQEGEVLTDAYSGWRGQVRDGRIQLQSEGTVLLELDKQPV